MNWVAKFFPSRCKFQDLFSGRMIDNVKECVGLYFLEDNQVNVNKQAQALSGESILSILPTKLCCGTIDLATLIFPICKNCSHHCLRKKILIPF